MFYRVLVLLMIFFIPPVMADIEENNPSMCLAYNIYWESRNQSLEGKWRVGQVVMNRVKHKGWPNDVCGVVMKAKRWNGAIIRDRCQFSWYCDGKSDVPNIANKKELAAWNLSVQIATYLLSLPIPDITGGAVYYHNRTVEPWWAARHTYIALIDDHYFYGQ